MTTRFRVVDHAATGQRYRTVSPASHQYESPARAKIAAELAQGQPGKFDSTFGSIPWSPTGGGADVEGNLLAMAGLPGTPSAFGTHKGRHGFPVPNIFNAIGPGTRLGSVLQMSDAGREFASLMNQRRGGSDGGSYGNLFGVGGRLYGRTWGTGLVADPNNGTGGTGGTGATSRRYGNSDPQRYGGQGGTSGGYGGSHGAGGGPSGPPTPGQGAATHLLRDLKAEAEADAEVFSWGEHVAFPVGKAAAHLTMRGLSLLNKFKSLFEYPVGPDGSVSPSPLDPSVGGAGYYPTMTPEQSGGHAMSSALLLDTLAEAYRRMQEQAHLPAGSDAGGGGGTSTAPERLFLHGMKHWYDAVAGRR